MPPSVATVPASWRDQFAEPSIDVLVAEVEADPRKLLNLVRKGLLALDKCEETLGWHGIPWRWSLEYTVKGETRAYIVPEPERPSLAMPIRAAEIDAINLRGLSRPVREGVVNAAYVAGVLWAEWELTAATQVNDLLNFQSKLLGVTTRS